MSEVDDNGDSNYKPSDIIALTDSKSVPLNLLPQKSRERYEKTYQIFNQWCEDRDIHLFNENDLLEYFNELAVQKQSSTLWSIYSMLKSSLIVKKNIDISKYRKLNAYLRKKSIGFKAKKSKILTRENINAFLSTAPDNHYLMMKIALIIGVSGACRKDELTKITVDDIEDQGTVLVVKMPNTVNGLQQRAFVITDGVNRELTLFRKYISLRPTNVTTRRLFLRYEKGRCINQVVGTNTLATFPRIIAEYLNLPESTSYTGHCFRKTSASLLSNAITNIVGFKKSRGWKCITGADICSINSIENKVAISKTLLGDKQGTPMKIIDYSSTTNEPLISERKRERSRCNSTEEIEFEFKEIPIIKTEHPIEELENIEQELDEPENTIDEPENIIINEATPHYWESFSKFICMEIQTIKSEAKKRKLKREIIQCVMKYQDEEDAEHL